MLMIYANYVNYAKQVVRSSIANAYLPAIGWLAQLRNSACSRKRAALLGHADHGCRRYFLPREKIPPGNVYKQRGFLLVAPGHERATYC